MRWPDDAPRSSRWQQLRQRVGALEEERLLRWVLLANVSLVSLWIVVSLVVTVVQGVATLVGLR